MNAMFIKEFHLTAIFIKEFHVNAIFIKKFHVNAIFIKEFHVNAIFIKEFHVNAIFNKYETVFYSIDVFSKRHRLVHNSGFPKFEALYCGLDIVISTEILVKP